MSLTFFMLATLLSASPSAGDAYLPPGAADTGGMRHFCLLYHGQTQRAPWTAETLRPYVACMNAEGRPTDWLFDSFLFIEFATNDGKQLYYHDKTRQQPDMADWQWLADAWFRPGSGLEGLEACVAAIGQDLGQADHCANVVITLPVPFKEMGDFGALPGQGQSLDFSRIEDQHAAMNWYIETVSNRFRAGNFKHLNLLGFYWTGESIGPRERGIVRWTADTLHPRNLRFYWIPYFSADGVAEWRALGFDAMMLQPNYFFDGDGGVRRLSMTAQRAQRFGCGVEMEFDGRALTSADQQQRFWDYLDAGAVHGWMQNALVGWYEGGGALGALSRQPETGRPMYEALCQFVKGEYKPRAPQRIPPVEVPTARGENNLALAAKGAKVTGALDDGNPGLAPERMLDGDISSYTGSSGLAWFVIPGSITVELPVPAVVTRVQMLLFDLDDRYYSYRLETSPDGQAWTPAADKAAAQARGWQVDRFPARETRYLRLTGLANSTGQPLMQVVEFEVYADITANPTS